MTHQHRQIHDVGTLRAHRKVRVEGGGPDAPTGPPAGVPAPRAGVRRRSFSVRSRVIFAIGTMACDPPGPPSECETGGREAVG